MNSTIMRIKISIKIFIIELKVLLPYLSIVFQENDQAASPSAILEARWIFYFKNFYAIIQKCIFKVFDSGQN